MTGVVLFSINLAGDDASATSSDSILCALVNEKLLSGSNLNSNSGGGGVSTYMTAGGATTVRWLTPPSNTGLIFSALFATAVAQHSTYVDDLLRSVCALWCDRFMSRATVRGHEVGAIPEDAAAIGAGVLVAAALSSSSNSSGGGEGGGGEAFPFLDEFEKLLENAEKKVHTKTSFASGGGGGGGGSDVNPIISKNKNNKGGGGGGGGVGKGAATTAGRQWTVSPLDSSALDRSRPATASELASIDLLHSSTIKFSGTATGARNLDDDDEDENSAVEEEKGKKAKFSTLSWLMQTGSRASALLSGLSKTAPRKLAPDELDALLTAVQEKLASANVANDVSDALVARVAEGLRGKELSDAADASAAISESLSIALERVLCPRAPPDLVRDAKAKAAAAASAGIPMDQRSPFIIVFCGVNGVGKSTTLAKVAYMLKDAGLSVSVAACDSFRAGAVEQLKRHTTALGISLFEQGYARDPVSIARGAIVAATKAGTQVVLIDTAGRMQNNKELMAQLARLVAAHSPDTVLFVGEALVGHDGADQLSSFDLALTDYIGGNRARRIDGIVLTKFDAVDNKVGTAVSMVYKTGIPIAFVGVGQTYPDLRRLNVRAVVDALIN
jgi:signal recognition particle receptor subunit alpha